MIYVITGMHMNLVHPAHCWVEVAETAFFGGQMWAKHDWFLSDVPEDGHF